MMSNDDHQMSVAGVPMDLMSKGVPKSDLKKRRDPRL